MTAINQIQEVTKRALTDLESQTEQRKWKAQKIDADANQVDENEEADIEPVVVVEVPTAVALYDRVKEAVGSVLEVAKSGNLEDEDLRTLEEAAASTLENTKILYERLCLIEESGQLQAENTRFQSEVEALQKELTERRAELPPTQVAQESDLLKDILHNILVQVDTLIKAHVEDLKNKPCPESREAAIREDGLTDTSGMVKEAGSPGEDVSSTREKPYWWTEEIAELRRVCMAARRAYGRHRRRKVCDETLLKQLYRQYRNATKAVQLAISTSKNLGKDVGGGDT